MRCLAANQAVLAASIPEHQIRIDIVGRNLRPQDFDGRQTEGRASLQWD